MDKIITVHMCGQKFVNNKIGTHLKNFCIFLEIRTVYAFIDLKNTYFGNSTENVYPSSNNLKIFYRTLSDIMTATPGLMTIVLAVLHKKFKSFFREDKKIGKKMTFLKF